MLGDTLLANFSHDEIETVLAHELGHHVHRDLPLGIVVQSVIALANQNLVDADPPAWVEFLLHSHTSISKRVAMAESFIVEE